MLKKILQVRKLVYSGDTLFLGDVGPPDLAQKATNMTQEELAGIISVWLIKKFKIKTMYGESISIVPKTFSKGQIYGGLIFGFGWAITGACPGPLFAQIGTGTFAVIITLVSAIFGTWIYGYFREKLPH